MCMDMEELGWEQGVTGGCHPLCVLWHFECPALGMLDPDSCH